MSDALIDVEPTSTEPTSTEPTSTEPTSTEPTSDEKIELANKHDWAKLITTEEYKKDTDITQFKTVDELVSAYSVLNAKVKKGTQIEPLKEDATVEQMQEKSEALFGIKKDSYSEDFEHADAAYKFRLPSKLVEPFLKEIDASTSSASEKDEKETLLKYKEEVLSKEPEETFSTRFEAGLKALGMTKQEYAEELPTLVRNKPKLVLAIVALGKKQFTKGENSEIDNDSELPSDIGVLSTHIADLAKQRMNAKLNGRDYYHIEDKLKQYKMRHHKLSQELRKQENQVSQLA